MRLQVRENDWETVVTILLALMEHLPQTSHSPAAAKFLPALNEVCCFMVRSIEF
jgi:hypothetical protein